MEKSVLNPAAQSLFDGAYLPLKALGESLQRGETYLSYLACADTAAAILTLCCRFDGLAPASREELLSLVPQTRLGKAFLINLDGYLRVCLRLSDLSPGRKAETYPQYSDARRLLERMERLVCENGFLPADGQSNLPKP